MDNLTHRPRLRRGRRIPINVTLAPNILKALHKIGDGNRSAAIEKLVGEHLERERSTQAQAELT